MGVGPGVEGGTRVVCVRGRDHRGVRRGAEKEVGVGCEGRCHDSSWGRRVGTPPPFWITFSDSVGHRKIFG